MTNPLATYSIDPVLFYTVEPWVSSFFGRSGPSGVLRGITGQFGVIDSHRAWRFISPVCYCPQGGTRKAFLIWCWREKPWYCREKAKMEKKGLRSWEKWVTMCWCLHTTVHYGDQYGFKVTHRICLIHISASFLIIGVIFQTLKYDFISLLYYGSLLMISCWGVRRLFTTFAK